MNPNQHTPYIRELSDKEDWAALIRYWIAWQQTDAFDAAFNIIRSRIGHTGYPWHELAAFLTAVKESPFERRKAGEWMRDFAEKEVGTLQLLLWMPFAIRFQYAELVPFERSEDADLAFKMTQQAASLANDLADPALEAQFHTIAAIGCEGIGERELAAHLLRTAADTLCTMARKGNQDTVLPRIVGLLTGVANLLCNLGRREEANYNAQLACAIFETLAEQNSVELITAGVNFLNTLAAVLHDLMQLEEALKIAKWAWVVYQKLARQNPAEFLSDYASALNNVVTILIKLGRPDEALPIALRACVIRAKLARQNPAELRHFYANSLNTLAGVLIDLKRPDLALKRAQRACALNEGHATQYPSEYRQFHAVSLNTLAVILRHLGRIEEAVNAAREGTRLIEELGRQLPYFYAECAVTQWTALGRLLRKGESANMPNYRGAAVAFRRAREWDATLQSTWLDAEERRRVRVESRDLFCLSILNALDLSQTSSDASEREAVLAEAAEVAEANRSRMLAQKLVDEELAPRNLPSAPPDLAGRFRDVRRLLRELTWQWEREAGGVASNGTIGDPMPAMRISPICHPTPEGAAAARQIAAEREKEHSNAEKRARDELMTKLKATRQNAADLLAEIRKSDPEYEPDGVPPVASLADIRAALPKDAAAVSFVLMQEETVALIVTRDTLDAVRMREFDIVDATAWGHDWLASYFARPSRPVRAADEGEVAWTLRQRLWQAAVQEQLENWLSDIATRLVALEGPLIAPLVEALERIEQRRGKIMRLILCPSITLHLAPLHACRIPGSRQRLGDRWPVAYTPSLSMLVRFSKRERDLAQPALLVTNPTEDLRFTEVEAAALASHYPDARTLHRTDATREAVLAHAPNAGVFVYSGHMHFHLGEPLRGTAAVMAHATGAPVSASASKESTRDGSRDVRDELGRFVPPTNWLTLADIFAQLNLTRCRLAVNNGCESALRPFFHKLQKRAENAGMGNIGEDNPQFMLDTSDDAESLVTGFLFAGAPAVIGTLWAVWDISAALLMDRFHSLWRGGAGLSPGDALHAAVRWLRGDEDVADSIRTGRQLIEKVLPVFLKHVPDAEVRADCERMAQAHFERSPDGPPFSAPGHWAAFTANGAVFWQSYKASGPKSDP